MNAEFNWWLLIVGLVIGGGLVWLVLLDSRRREDEISAQERAVEATWLSDVLAEEGTALSPALAERVLQLHAEYLATSVPGDGPAPSVMDPATEGTSSVRATSGAAAATAGRSPFPAAVETDAATADASPSLARSPAPTREDDRGA